MPVHDWTRVEAGIFHHFHHRWISSISDALNDGVLPPTYYALAEQMAGGLGPDVLTLQGRALGDVSPTPRVPTEPSGSVGLLVRPVPLTAQTDLAYYRRKQNTVAVRHVSGDRVVAVIEILSPGDKASDHAMRSFLAKATELIEKGVHLLLLDLHPPGARDPDGIHAAIWQELTGGKPDVRPVKPLTLAAYESSLVVNAYVVPVAVGEELPPMPLYLEPDRCVLVPLEATYQETYAKTPRRWREVLEAAGRAGPEARSSPP